MKTMAVVALLLAGIFLFVGCSGMSDTTKRTGTGAATGAVVGGVVGSFYGSAGAGAAIGAAVGGAGGYVYDQHVKSKDKAYQDGVQAGKQTPAK
jgi:osmotically inducible lipoprotein OsmB